MYCIAFCLFTVPPSGINVYLSAPWQLDKGWYTLYCEIQRVRPVNDLLMELTKHNQTLVSGTGSTSENVDGKTSSVKTQAAIQIMRNDNGKADFTCEVVWQNKRYIQQIYPATEVYCKYREKIYKL